MYGSWYRDGSDDLLLSPSSSIGCSCSAEYLVMTDAMDAISSKTNKQQLRFSRAAADLKGVYYLARVKEEGELKIDIMCVRLEA